MRPMDNKTGLLPIADLTEIQRGKMKIIMFGGFRKKAQGKAAPELPTEVVGETDHDGANVRGTILTSNVS